MLLHRRVTPSINLVVTSAVRVKCLAQQHNTLTTARPGTDIARFEVQRANLEVTSPPPTKLWQTLKTPDGRSYITGENDIQLVQQAK